MESLEKSGNFSTLPLFLLLPCPVHMPSYFIGPSKSAGKDRKSGGFENFIWKTSKSQGIFVKEVLRTLIPI